MVGGIGNDTMSSLPSIELGTDSGTSQQEQRRGGSASTPTDTVHLSPEAQQHISKLQQRDREVRNHEQIHISAGGSHVNGGASYSYQRGPDNRQYAVGGSVAIDTSPVPGDPQATKEKARQIRSAALAPSNPSAQDQSVAAQASNLEAQAQQEKGTADMEATGSSSVHSTAGTLSAPFLPQRPADFAARAAAAYQTMQQQTQMPTQVAPWGTGIALTV